MVFKPRKLGTVVYSVSQEAPVSQVPEIDRGGRTSRTRRPMGTIQDGTLQMASGRGIRNPVRNCNGLELGIGHSGGNGRNQMKNLELVFVGIKGSVVALNRETGGQVWARRLGSTDFVNVVVEGERVFATTYGEIFCLDPVTGEVLWHNKLKGHGTGLAAIVTSEKIGI